MSQGGSHFLSQLEAVYCRLDGFTIAYLCTKLIKRHNNKLPAVKISMPSNSFKFSTSMLRAFYEYFYKSRLQLGRFGYDSLKLMQNTIASVQQENIPLDVVHTDIDYMMRYQDFTLNSVSFFFS